MLSTAERDELKAVREAGRKSLYFLCTRILNYTDVDPVIHRPFIEPLDALVADCTGTDIVESNGSCLYIPDNETLSTALPANAKRRYMLQAFRGSLKTTINTQSHLIQLLLNFPHMAALIYHNTEDVAKSILKEIVDHFDRNETFKRIYPEFALRNPKERRAAMSDSGTAFTSPVRKKVESVYPLKKEPTFKALGLASSQAGMHVSVMKMTDVVEESNSGTPSMRNKVYRNIQTAMNLLEDPGCIAFIEGTPYDPDDAYNRIVQRQFFNKPPHKRTWHFTFVPAYQIDTREKPRTYEPDELSLPWLKAKRTINWSPTVKTKKGQYVPVWPTWRGGQPKFTNDALEDKRSDDPFVFACQQLLKPAAEDASVLPPSQCFHRFPASEIGTLDQQLRILTVDTAETINEDWSNDTAMTGGIVTQTLLRVVTHGVCEKLEAEDILDLLFQMNSDVKPHIIFIEDTSFVRGLKPLILEREQKYNLGLPIEYLARKQTASKKMRIKGALRAPMLARRLMFSSALSDSYVERVLFEMSGFPRAKQDDVLDTLADFVSANSDIQGYNNPKIREQALKDATARAMQEDFNTWADRMMGRIPDESDYDSDSSYGF